MLPSEQNLLVEEYRNGNRRAGDELFNSMAPFIGAMAAFYGDQREYDGIEAFGVGTEVFTEALLTWDPDKGYKYFAHYVKQQVRWRMTNARTKVVLRQKLAYTLAASHTTKLDVDFVDRQAQLEAHDILGRLPSEGTLGRIIELKAQGMSNVQVGKELGVSNQYVSRLLNNLWAEVNK